MGVEQSGLLEKIRECRNMKINDKNLLNFGYDVNRQLFNVDMQLKVSEIITVLQSVKGDQSFRNLRQIKKQLYESILANVEKKIETQQIHDYGETAGLIKLLNDLGMRQSLHTLLKNSIHFPVQFISPVDYLYAYVSVLPLPDLPEEDQQLLRQKIVQLQDSLNLHDSNICHSITTIRLACALDKPLQDLYGINEPLLRQALTKVISAAIRDNLIDKLEAKELVITFYSLVLLKESALFLRIFQKLQDLKTVQQIPSSSWITVIVSLEQIPKDYIKTLHLDVNQVLLNLHSVMLQDLKNAQDIDFKQHLGGIYEVLFRFQNFKVPHQTLQMYYDNLMKINYFELNNFDFV